MKTIRQIFIALCLMSALSGFAQTWDIGSPVAANVTATFENDTLTISGTGAMQDFHEYATPWFKNRSNIKTLVIEEGITNIGNYAFDICSIITISFPESLTSIGNYAFNICQRLTSLTLPENLVTIGNYAFYRCDVLTSVTIPKKVTTIGISAFGGCGHLASISLPESLTTIGSSALSGCNFTSITIPSGVTNIGNFAFRDNDNLTSMTFKNPTPIPLLSTGYVLYGVNKTNCTLYVPAALPYKKAYGWQDFVNIIGEYPCVYADANNSACGSVTGGGIIKEPPVSVTLTAIAKTGYRFINWTKAGVEVSTENPYTFTATEDLDLVANFIGINANLSSLGVNGYTINPAFNANTTYYSITATIPYTQTSINITAQKAHFGATIATGNIGNKTLSVGENIFNIIVTAEDGITEKTYTLVANRAAPSTNVDLQSLCATSSVGGNCYELNSVFNANTTYYAVTETIPYSQTSINITVQKAHSGATIAAGNIGGKILSVGENTFNITVTAEDGITKKTYTLVVNRALPSANLASLYVSNVKLTPAFDPTITEYTVNVPYFTTYISGNGYAVDNKSTIDLGYYVYNDYAFKFYKENLQVGENIISITVTAEDGVTKKTYTVVITREAMQEREETINVTTPGTLNSNLFADFFSKPITKLTITGNIDVRDIRFLDSLQYLNSLDLGDANIVSYEGMVGGWDSMFYPANELPDRSLGYMSYLTYIALPKTLTSIGNIVLSSNDRQGPLTSIHIPEGVTKIGYGCFLVQNALTTVTLPSTLTEIGSDSFLYCENLSVVINYNPNPIKIDCVFSCGYPFQGNVPTLYVPCGSGKLYKEADVWKYFNVVELPCDTISVTPSDNSAIIEWQPYENAEGYRLIFYGNEAHTDTLRILKFNADGLLIDSIIYKAKSVTQIANEAYKYVFGNLLNGTDYYYTLETLGINNVVLTSQSGAFTTKTVGVVETRYAASLRVVGYYSILGQKLPQEPQSGLYIILYDNGKAEKVLK